VTLVTPSPQHLKFLLQETEPFFSSLWTEQHKVFNVLSKLNGNLYGLYNFYPKGPLDI